MRRWIASLFVLAFVVSLASTIEAKNPRTVTPKGTVGKRRVGVKFICDKDTVIVNFDPGTTEMEMQDQIAAAFAGKANWKAEKFGRKVTISHKSKKKEIKVIKSGIRNTATIRCGILSNVAQFASDELLELSGMPMGGEICLTFAGSLGMVCATTTMGMELEEAMMALDLELNALIPDTNVTFGVDIESSGRIYMPLDNFDLIGEDINLLSFSSTDPGLTLGYAPCPTEAIPTLSEWGMIIMFVVMAAGIVWFVVRQRRRMATA